MRITAVSPHLDDAAFSVGASLAGLADAGHDVSVITCFTASVPDPTGFALACQTDKGIAADVDYMALRREEDAKAMGVLGVAHEHLDLPEAPHRGYTCAEDLFAGFHDGDEVWQDVLERLGEHTADLWLAPRAMGGHIDHLQVLRAVVELVLPTAYWRDSPYVLREPEAQPGLELPENLVELEVTGDPAKRADACACYGSQLDFQFGGEQPMRDALASLTEPLAANPEAVVLLTELGAR